MKELRRKDREISEDEARSILNSAEYGVLSTASMEALPYGVPLSFCLIDGCIYFHCAIEGRKIDNLESNRAASFCAVGKTEVMPSKFGIKYESVIVSGEAAEAFDDEKRMALDGLLQKYSPEHIEDGAKYIETLWDKTRVFKITADHISGKSRRQ